MVDEKVAVAPEEKIGPSDLRAEAEEMLRNGTMPRLDDVLAAVAAVREEFADPIRKARLKPVDEAA